MCLSSGRPPGTCDSLIEKEVWAVISKDLVVGATGLDLSEGRGMMEFVVTSWNS
jgi:hypothetical protein